MSNHTLSQLGFTGHFASQLSLDDFEQLTPMRVTEVQRDRLFGIGEQGANQLTLVGDSHAGDFAVGDWVLVDDATRVTRRLEPKSSLSRRAAGTDASVQLIANNVDTLLIVSSCNADFSVARLERYLALATEAEVTPVVVLN
ncbi:MAG: GTPase RsgA, partial [Granulosicoccaceae bacterium]